MSNRRITLQVIKCKTCYDLGEIVDRLDRAKRTPCPCQPPKPTSWPCPCLAERAELDRDVMIFKNIIGGFPGTGR